MTEGEGQSSAAFSEPSGVTPGMVAGIQTFGKVLDPEFL